MSHLKSKIPNFDHSMITPGPHAHTDRIWYRYLAGIEELSTQLQDVDDTTGGKSLAQLITKVQEILDAFKAE